MKLEEQILNFLRLSPRQSFHLNELLRQLQLKKGERRQLRQVLKRMVREGKIALYRNKHYGLPRQGDEEISGIVEFSGNSTLIRLISRPDLNLPEVLPVRRSEIGSAMQGDKVALKLIRGRKRNSPLKVIITRVVERGRKVLVGRFQFYNRNSGIVIPRDTRLKRNVIIRHIPPKCKVQNDDWVVVRLVEYPVAPEPLVGEIKEVIGAEDKPGVDIYLIIRDYGVEPKFSPAVLHEAKELPLKLMPEEIAERRDLRKLKTFTIDPVTAKDFDDALSIERLSGGIFRLGVHIADVSYYVKPGTKLDKEARDRGTSIYPVDRVVPMLPEQLSNHICSLRPDEDHATFSVFMDIAPDGEVIRSEMIPSIIRSAHRLTYEEVEAIYDGSDRWITSRYADIIKELTYLFELTPILIKRRDQMGRLDLDIPEGEVIFNSAGEVIDLRRRPRLFSHRVVEEAMLLANETVARHITDLHLPCIYRVHEPPDQEKLELLIPIFLTFGIDIGRGTKTLTAYKLQRVLAASEHTNWGWIVRRLILRSLKHAVYSAENKGHYGIATDCYTHFTSPIRRYPDVIVHRILREAIKGKRPTGKVIAHWEAELPEIASLATRREQRAEDIEREAFLVKSLEYMKHHLGEEFEGTISGVSPWGFYVELDLYPVEGLVAVRSLTDDVYRYNERELILSGLRRQKKIRLGDRVLVMVERVDIEKRHIDFKLLKKISHN